jgi:Bacterial Ig-like domain/Bacterial Ig domain
MTSRKSTRRKSNVRALLVSATVAAALVAPALASAISVGPTITAVTPASPSNDLNPKVRGSGATDPSTVSIYDNPTCAGTALGSGTAADFNGATGIAVTVPANTTTHLYASTTPAEPRPCSTPAFDYVSDTTPPAVVINSGPNGPTNDQTPTFAFTVESGSTTACKINTTSFTACSSPFTPPTISTDGFYVFTVQATDAAGNTATATRSFSVDTVPPTVSIDSGPDGPTNDPTPTFGFSSESGATAACKIDGISGFVACTSTFTPSHLADGHYTFIVHATDTAGNVSADVTRDFIVDTVPPAVTTIGGPSGPTNDNTPTFGFISSSFVTFECSLDQGTPHFAVCLEPFTSPTLPDGAYTFRVRGTDTAGNTSGPATRSFSVDATPPAVSVSSGPSGPTTDPRPSFTFAAESGATVQCSISSGAASFGPCSGAASHQPPANLADAAYTFTVQATDSVGNTATATRSFSVDTTAPGAPALTATDPASPANDNSPKVKGSAEAGSTVKLYDNAACSGSSIGSGTAAELGGAGITVSVPDDTVTDLHATAADSVGNVSACSTGLAYTERSTLPANPAPEITSLKVTPKNFAADPGATPVQRASGSTIEITLSEDALVHFHIGLAPDQAAKRPKNPHVFRRHLPAGANTVAFTGTLGKRTFAPGRYVLTARARDSAGQASSRVTTGFRVLP